MRVQPTRHTRIRESSLPSTCVGGHGGGFAEQYVLCEDGIERKGCWFGPRQFEVLQRRAGCRLRVLRKKEAWAWVGVLGAQ